MGKSKATPIKDLFTPEISKSKKSLIWHINENLKYYGIETIEQLTTYNPFAFRWGGNTEGRGNDHGKFGYFTETQYKFLEKCLQKKGLSFAEEIQEPRSAYGIIGKENIKQYLYEEVLKNGEEFRSTEKISREARNHLVDTLYTNLSKYRTSIEDLYGFPSFAIEARYTKPLLEELADEGKIERAKTSAGNFFRAQHS